MNTLYDMVVMGDINLDWCSQGLLSFPFSELVVNGIIEWAPIDELPGGSGLNFARFAQKAGYNPLLLGKIGEGPVGDSIYAWLKQYGLESGISRATSLGTGKAFIARDKNRIRFLVNNEPNANQALSVLDVERHADVIAFCNILYVSGYCAMYPEAPRKLAAERAMELARNGLKQTHIVFDVVPHLFYKIYTFSQFRELTHEVDILISEVATMRRFLDMGHKDETLTRDEVERTAKHLTEFYNRFILRFGPSGCDEQIIWDGRSSQLTWEETGHDEVSESEKRGFGDRLAIRVLKEIFSLTPACEQRGM